MSLITLRNTNGQSPSTFENDFNNTFEIGPNSEVALHSIALNRLPQHEISDKFFYVYHGVRINDTYCLLMLLEETICIVYQKLR